ncbi:unnamed protein product [Albugo candida]|uniref:Uncharacterized protein n=1 Tax=Albugo candida TaxID=65357 RepID=A0A024G4M4_9STRA|nr:unnamed protein product [Albugo candida]|eukprot:CCI41487.1 unnamed protein product [Albugo candida]
MLYRTREKDSVCDVVTKMSILSECLTMKSEPKNDDLLYCLIIVYKRQQPFMNQGFFFDSSNLIRLELRAIVNCTRTIP